MYTNVRLFGSQFSIVLSHAVGHTINDKPLEQCLTMTSVLITGANRGLGLGMVKYLTKHDKAGIIFATCRKPSEVWNKLNFHLPIGAIISFNLFH